ncbi:cache domain-containing protein [Neptuniibacter sp.]|uniref:cache domain-containing protein n=1 Tax=Neptuniibacter sp. TaxID=1962643 RepID=UPI003B5B2E6A
MSVVEPSRTAETVVNYRRALKYCHHYKSFDEDLSKLNRFWDSISTIGSINQDLLQGHGTPLLESMRETRSNFTSLQERLLQSLVGETIAKAKSELSFFAQNTIDILIRNLFERTADVGFLAVDEIVRDFLQSEEVSVEQMRQRLQAYTQKYSVYDEILILDQQGKVKSQLNSSNQIEIPDNPLLRQIDQADEYFEFYGYSSFYPQRSKSHIFASRIYTGQGEGQQHIGYLVLFFRFEDELSRIYQQMLKGGDTITLLLVDEKNSVISSSNPSLLSVGEKVDGFNGTLDRPIMLKNQEYLSVSLPSTGYQGYMGLDWTARALMPVSKALDVPLQKKRQNGSGDEIVLSSSLSQIYQESHNINRKLRIVTINGKSLAARLEVRTFVPILEKIQDVGNEMTGIISDSIGMLSQTVMGAVLSDCRLYSGLAIDIMDRNLYERANDCRWWALAPTFIEELENAVKGDVGSQQQLESTLKYINELYTVYTNIIVFGLNGEVIACSQESETSPLSGTLLSDKTLIADTSMISNPQSYAVSDFCPTPEYSGKSTYIYSAAIRNESGLPKAGVGVVFDSEPEFQAMLESALPRDSFGNPIPGSGGLFVTPDGLVISTTSTEYRVGERINLPLQITRLRNGQSYEGVVNLDARQLLLGATASSGYREYKTTGDYENPVIAVIYVDPVETA